MRFAQSISSASLRALLLAAATGFAACAGVAPAEQASPRGLPPGVFPVPSSTSPPPSAAPAPKHRHLAFGTPRPLTPKRTSEVLLDRGEFVVSYDEQIHLARWVAWSVRKSDLGKAKRKNVFHPDTELPEGLLRIDTSDYVRSGYDRGHLCPSADRTATAEANHRTFLMTNMHAQKHGLNAGPWEELEGHTRDLLRRPEDVVYVVAGPLVDADPPRIGRGVAVPRASYKVLIATKDGVPAADIRDTVYHAAAIMPNDDSAETQHWRTYETSIREVEQAAGYDFFADIAADVQERIETKRGMP